MPCWDRFLVEYELYVLCFVKLFIFIIIVDNRYPTFFDDIVARLLPVIPLVVYRLIENDAIESADRILAMYSALLAFHPLRFTFVRDILAYFYGHLPGKLVVRILNVLVLSKVVNFLFPALLS